MNKLVHTRSGCLCALYSLFFVASATNLHARACSWVAAVFIWFFLFWQKAELSFSRPVGFLPSALLAAEV